MLSDVAEKEDGVKAVFVWEAEKAAAHTGQQGSTLLRLCTAQ